MEISSDLSAVFVTKFPMHYRINTPSIIYEVIDGEAIMLNLDEGIYYSLNSSGRHIWDMIANHFSEEEIKSSFLSKDPVQIDSFFQELLFEKLITEDVDQEEKSVLKKAIFEPPVLHTYQDMKELLLLDPIHEVDQSGWPEPKK